MDFESLYGHYAVAPTPQSVIAAWHYAGTNVPPAGLVELRINLWLKEGLAPTQESAMELVVKNVEFTPEP